MELYNIWFFGDWFISPGIMFVRFNQVVAHIRTSFFYCQIIFHCKDKQHYIHSSTDEHFGCFYFLSTMIWIMLLLIFAYKFLCGCIFSFLLDIYTGVKFLDYTLTMFTILRKCQTIFQSSCTSLYSQQQWGGPISPHTHEHLLFFWLHPS